MSLIKHHVVSRATIHRVVHSYDSQPLYGNRLTSIARSPHAHPWRCALSMTVKPPPTQSYRKQSFYLQEKQRRKEKVGMLEKEIEEILKGGEGIGKTPKVLFS